MDATTMPSTHSILDRLKQDFPNLTFVSADDFWWSAANRTVYIDSQAENNQILTLHELSHALLGHIDYDRDIELLKLERDAWEYAKTTLSKKYNVPIDEEIIQDHLDTYRHWIYARSRCPQCSTNGIQMKERIYECISCNHKWRVNEARLCALRRYGQLSI